MHVYVLVFKPIGVIRGVENSSVCSANGLDFKLKPPPALYQQLEQFSKCIKGNNQMSNFFFTHPSITKWTNKFWIEEWKCNFPAAFLGNYDRPTDRSTNHIARDGHESCHWAFTFPISCFSIHTDITKFIGDLIAAKYWACFFYVISLTPFIYAGPSL